MSIDWEQFKGEYIKWTEKGQVAEGVVRDIRIGSYQNNAYPELTLEMAEGSKKLSANQANLKRQLADDPPNVGTRIRVEYLGEASEHKPGQNPTKLFVYTKLDGSAGPKVEDLA